MILIEGGEKYGDKNESTEIVFGRLHTNEKHFEATTLSDNSSDMCI